MLKKLIFGAIALTLAAASFAQDYSLFGNHNQPSPVYQPGEPMVFTVTLLDGDQPVTGKKMKWKRTGDDGITQTGEGVSAKDGLKITTSLAQAGFVRLYVTAYGEDGQALRGGNGQTGKAIFFDGGAGVAPETLKGVPEPGDFDRYWQLQKKKLAAVPLNVIEMTEVPGNDSVKAYDVTVACAGKMPVSGYLTLPRNAAKGSLPATVSFMGYGVDGAWKNLEGGKNQIYFHINAHGIRNGQPQDYYTALAETTLKGYAFSPQENAAADTCYFNGMFLRVMRALEFVKSLPEWNGQELGVDGGSQGGLQALAAAGLDRDVTSCGVWAPWSCDLGRTELKRMASDWCIAYTPALNYYDPIHHVKRANPKCRLSMSTGLGDYVSPPSSVWIVYNNFPGPKTLELRQGCEHGFSMRNYPRFTVSAGPAAR